MDSLLKIATVYKTPVISLTALLTTTSPEFTTSLKEKNKQSTPYEWYHGVNAGLTLELLASYKAQIDHLTKLDKVLEERVRDLVLGL